MTKSTASIKDCSKKHKSKCKYKNTKGGYDQFNDGEAMKKFSEAPHPNTTSYENERRARSTKEWWISVYYYLLFKYKYPEFIIYKHKTNSKAKVLTNTNAKNEKYKNDVYFNYDVELNKEALKNNIWKEKKEYNELLKYLFHAGDGNLLHDDPQPLVIQSTYQINYYVSEKRYKFKKDKISNFVPDLLIDHCYTQFKKGRDNFNGFGIFNQDNIKPLLAVFIHYAINNFKQIKGKVLSSDKLNKHLQIFYIAPGLFSLYRTSQFEFMNYPGVLYHYIEVMKEFDKQDQVTQKYKNGYKANLKISRHINNLPGSNYGMADDLFVTDINNNLNDAYDDVKVEQNSYVNNLKFENNITISNIFEMKTKYKDFYTALKDGWFINNNSNDAYNIRNFFTFKWLS
jgi:hypothetical protein